ncbi:MAG: malonyl-ACP O-methyltransferase BioC [Methylococcales bacterium]
MSAGIALNKAWIKQSFATAAGSYDGVAGLQRSVGNALLADVQAFGTVLDLGCGTGFLTGKLRQSAQIEQLLALDIALPMLEAAKNKLSHLDVAYLCADAECLPLIDSCLDMVFSNLALQWCHNPQALFADLQRVLKVDGKLLFSTFGPQTLQELKTSWAAVDSFSHVNDFYAPTKLQDFLQRAGFKDIGISRQLVVSHYGSVLDLMKELKQLGAHHVMAGRNTKLTSKTQLQQMFARYEDFRSQGNIPASFEVIFVTAGV